MSIQRVEVPSRIAVIGDIHGCADQLRRLLARLPGMAIAVVGDVADRGPDSRGVIDQLIDRGAVGVRGNHEDWLLSWIRGEGFDSFALRPVMGGRATLDSYGVTGATPREIEAERWRVPPSHRKWLESLTDALEIVIGGQHWWVVHGGAQAVKGLAPEAAVPWLAEKLPNSLRVTAHDLENPPDLGWPIIVGHRVIEAPINDPRVIAIDTGAGVRVDRMLSAVVLPNVELVTVGPE